MKKFLAISLALVMVLALSVTCFAEITFELEELGEVSENVTVTYNDGAAAPDTYAIDIEWGDLSFEYTQVKQKWDAQNHVEVDDGTSGWVNNTATITVTNHSNVDVNAKIEYIAGTASGTASFALTGGNATDLAEATPAEQAKLQATLTASGVPAEDANNAVVGSIKVTIAAAA